MDWHRISTPESLGTDTYLHRFGRAPIESSPIDATLTPLAMLASALKLHRLVSDENVKTPNAAGMALGKVQY